MTIWSFLRAWQTSSQHIPWRPHVIRLLEERAWDSDREAGLLLETLREAGLEPDALLCDSGGDLRRAEDEEKRLRRKGLHCAIHGARPLPPGFRRMADPPLTLTYWGDLSSLEKPALAVVGSREPRAESLEWMELELGDFLRNEDAVIVSGGARGIDQKAHQLALRAKRPTMVLLPSGLENPYPSSWKEWRPWVEKTGGCLVSEYPAEFEMRKAHFHHRNRLIAAWGLMTLVVEARARSGTLITATRAAELGRPLVVVPGAPWDSAFEGNLQLLTEGATLLRGAEDLALFWRSEQCEQTVIPLDQGDSETRSH